MPRRESFPHSYLPRSCIRQARGFPEAYLHKPVPSPSLVSGTRPFFGTLAGGCWCKMSESDACLELFVSGACLDGDGSLSVVTGEMWNVSCAQLYEMG
jgi:hypothetical protein